jgi:hypothetical protein
VTRLDDRGCFPGSFLFAASSTSTLVLTQPRIQLVRVQLSTELKRPRREANHSPPSTAKFKKGWSYTPLPHICMVWHFSTRDNFKSLPSDVQVRQCTCAPRTVKNRGRKPWPICCLCVTFSKAPC